MFQSKYFYALLISLALYVSGYAFFRTQCMNFLQAAPYSVILSEQARSRRPLPADIKGKVSADLRGVNRALHAIYYPILRMDPKFSNVFE